MLFNESTNIQYIQYINNSSKIPFKQKSIMFKKPQVSLDQQPLQRWTLSILHIIKPTTCFSNILVSPGRYKSHSASIRKPASVIIALHTSHETGMAWEVDCADGAGGCSLSCTPVISCADPLRGELPSTHFSIMCS